MKSTVYKIVYKYYVESRLKPLVTLPTVLKPAFRNIKFIHANNNNPPFFQYYA